MVTAPFNIIPSGDPHWGKNQSKTDPTNTFVNFEINHILPCLLTVWPF